jgi:hypothetical protein
MDGGCLPMPIPQTARHAAADKAYKEMMLGADKLAAMGFKKKAIQRMISIHLGRRKSKHNANRQIIDAGLKALASKQG